MKKRQSYDWRFFIDIEDVRHEPDWPKARFDNRELSQELAPRKIDEYPKAKRRIPASRSRT